MDRHEELNADCGESIQEQGRRTKILNNWMRERKKLLFDNREEFHSVGLRSSFQLGGGLCVGSRAIQKAGNDLVWYHHCHT